MLGIPSPPCVGGGHSGRPMNLSYTEEVAGPHEDGDSIRVLFRPLMRSSGAGGFCYKFSKNVGYCSEGFACSAIPGAV